MTLHPAEPVGPGPSHPPPAPVRRIRLAPSGDRAGPWPTGRLLDGRLVSTWHCWFRSPAGRRRRAAWALAHPALRGWEAAELGAPVGSAATDRMQAALVELAQDGDVDAAMTLFVQLRPGLLRLIRSMVAGGGSFAEVADEVQAVFFETLYHHSLERRPARIAANLLLDTRQRLVTGRRAQDRVATVGTVDPGPRSRAERDRSAEDLIDAVATVHAVRSTLESLPGSPTSRRLSALLAYRAWILEEPKRAIADDLGLDPELVTTRLHRIRRALRQAGVDR